MIDKKKLARPDNAGRTIRNFRIVALEAARNVDYPNLISEALSRKLGTSADTLEIHHAVRDESWQPGQLNPKKGSGKP